MVPFQGVNAGAVSAADTVIVIGTVTRYGTAAHAKSNGNAKQNKANRCES